jgi:hypothetical protein
MHKVMANISNLRKTLIIMTALILTSLFVARHLLTATSNRPRLTDLWKPTPE